MNRNRLRRAIAQIGILREITRFLYFGARTAVLPLVRARIKPRSTEFRLIDGWHFYFYQRRARRSGSFSQHAQDVLVSQLTSGKTGGVFVDIGCNDPLRFNNTVLLERQFGWTGLSIDAQSQFAEQYKQQRSTPFIQACIGDVRTNVEFAQVQGRSFAGLSGVKQHLDSTKVSGRVQDVTEMIQRPLGDILRPSKIQRVDCLFIDVEGYEKVVLQGIDFAQTKIDYIVLENDVGLTGDNTVRNFLDSKGFELLARIYGDDVYRRKSAVTEKIELRSNREAVA